MFSSLSLGTAFQIPIRIHWTFWLLPLWILSSQNWESSTDAFFHLGLVFALFICVVLHELGHALAARRFGIATRSITLYPVGGVAALERMSQKPFEELVIAIAGPLVNVAIALLLAVGLAFSNAFPLLMEEDSVATFFFLLLALNIGMVLFNMLPAFPMDGGRVLRAILTWPFGLLKATRIAAFVGTIVMLLVALAGVFYLGNPWLVIIALFIYMAGQRELWNVEMQHWSQRVRSEWGPILFRQKPRSADPSTLVHVWDPDTQSWHVEERKPTEFVNG